MAPGGSITVNLTALNAVGQLLAREALAEWSDVLGVKFTEVSTGGQITFDDVDDGQHPHNTPDAPNGIINTSAVNVPRSWLVANGTTLDSYSFQTYIHEIGHALGLGHGGNYNTTADYPVDASYQNDCWSTTVMSYFDQRANTYFADKGFNYCIIASPMNGDIVAMQELYGTATTTRTGNTTYGYNTNADRAIFDASQFTHVAYTIVDHGGIDTLDYSGWNGAQTIDLRMEVFGSVLGNTGNLVIARGTTIENARGGNGNDVINGNAVSNILYGRGGSDTIRGDAGNDKIDGGSGADKLYGGNGNDIYYVDNALDKIIESTNAGTDTVYSTIGYVLSVNVEKLTLKGTASINATGNVLNNTLTGNSGANVLDGGAGGDVMIGGAGNDIYYVGNAFDQAIENASEGSDTVKSSISYTLGASLEHLTLLGTSDLQGTGNALANIITGNDGANVLDGAGGADKLIGGGGNDTFVLGTAGDVAVETDAAGGIDTVESSVSYTLGTNLEQLTLVGTGALNGTGNSLDNIITGNSGANVLNGAGGADRLVGGDGDDIYIVDDGRVVVVESSATGGTDEIRSSVSFVLSANVENLLLTGTAAVDATGNALNNVITGNAASNIIDGGAGADVMDGGDGADTYIVNNVFDRVIDTKAGDGDRVKSSVSFTLGANLDVLTLTGSAAINATGNDLDNWLYGNAANNVLDGRGGQDFMQGGAGDDTYFVDNSADLVAESWREGTDTVKSTASYVLLNDVENLVLLGTSAIDGTGNALANSLTGNAGANVLDGKGGADAMRGGGGDDSYFVDDAADVVVEGLGAGYDSVTSTISYVLGANIEELVLTGVGTLNGTGNALANRIIGNDVHNVIDGGSGADRMEGGFGADYYVVDNVGDVVVEVYDPNNVVDRITSSVTYTAPDQVEWLELTGSANVNATGNALNNTLIGNSGNNVLDGGAGADSMSGGAGNDTYILDNAGDTATDIVNGGIDTVKTYFAFTMTDVFENLVLLGSAAVDGYGNSADNIITGNDGVNFLFGNGGNDVVSGGLGNDRLRGGGGSDILTGGQGVDQFEFYGPEISAGVDTITDFVHGEKIVMYGAPFNGPAGTLDAGGFYIGTAAHDTSDRIIYDAATGNLYFDPDGAGGVAQQLFAILSPGLALTNSDFMFA